MEPLVVLVLALPVVESKRLPSAGRALGQDSTWLSKGLSLAKVAAYLGDTKEVVLATYAHFMPDDDDRAREIMNAFFAPTREGVDHNPCALIVPGDRHE